MSERSASADCCFLLSRAPARARPLLSAMGPDDMNKPRLAWFRDCSDYEGMVVALLLIAAIAAIWWLLRHKRWETVQKLVFWVVLVAALWVLVTVFGVPHPSS